MTAATLAGPTFESVETRLRDELAQGDAMVSGAAQILHRLLGNDDPTLFSDEVVARVRGMLADVARQLLQAQAEAARIGDRAAFVVEREEALVAALADNPAFLAHVHALAIEGRLALQLQTRGNIDPVLSPLLQGLVAARDDAVAGSAMAVLAAQARFIEHHRRMTLPLGELPGDLLHVALLSLTAQAGNGEQAAVAAAERSLRDGYDEGQGRFSLIARLIMRMGGDAVRALDVELAGLALFATALAMASGQERDSAVLSFSDRQAVRLALAMRAAGLPQTAVEEQFLHFHPEMALPDGFDELAPDRAAMLLAAATPRGA